MKMPCDYPQNKMRKAAALKRCLEVLEDLQRNYPPIFREDPLITGYQGQLQRDIDALQASLQED